MAETNLKCIPVAAMNRVLIIDDDKRNLQFLSDALSARGFEVFAAHDCEQGVCLASEKLPDLILCGLCAPRLAGCAVLSAQRCDERLADIPVAFLANPRELEEVRQSKNVAADHYLATPSDGESLFRAVEARLRSHWSEWHRREDQIEKAMQLFAGILHDLREPRSIASRYADFLQGFTNAPQPTQEVLTQALGPMQHALLRMQIILSETLPLAKSHAKRLSFHSSPFDLRLVCERLDR